MKYGLTPVGTMAHEFVCAIGGMFGPQMANHLAMNAWRSTFRGALGTYLYDSYGWEIFSLNFSEDFANLFKGLRVDSGDNYQQLQRIVDKYRSLGIDSRTKQVIFSNALTTDEAIAVHKYARHLCQPSFGIGTHFTNDFEGVHPMNTVIKLVAVKITEAWPFYNDTCKLSEDTGKHTGKPEVVQRFMEALHMQG
jgi:nicotinate phosphoribosyltransferase